MHRLLLLRHAKSDWPEGISDEERPLAPRGRAAAPRVGAYLAAEGLRPDLALVSPARRTRETWALVSAALGETEAKDEAAIYAASAGQLHDIVRALPEEVGTVLLVGHNPGMQDLANRLAGRGDRKDRARLTAKYPTAALAVIDFAEGAWADVSAGSGRLERFVTPKDLGGADDD